MTILEPLFGTLSKFRSHASGVDTSTSFLDLDSSAKSAKKRICILISKTVYEAIALDPSSEAHDALLSAMANLTLYNQMPHDILKLRKNEVDIYKSEQESIQRSYIENYYNAMDSLIASLEDSAQADWKGSRFHQLLSSLEIKSAENFDMMYGIDLSYLFFFRTAPLQKELLDEGLSAYFDRSVGNDSIVSTLQRVLAKKTVALALRRFDILEFPATIRNLFSEFKGSRSAVDEQNRMLSLADQLQHEANEQLLNIDLLLESNEGGAIDTGVDLNLESDKNYVMV